MVYNPLLNDLWKYTFSGFKTVVSVSQFTHLCVCLWCVVCVCVTYESSCAMISMNHVFFFFFTASVAKLWWLEEVMHRF